MKQWFVPVDLIRTYYGEEVAIYFEWMNFFLKWILPPGIAGLVFWILNCFFFDPESSPLNAIFAIVMSIWAALFAINWRKHERSLCISWDNMYQNEHQIQQIREDFVGTPKFNPVTELIEPDYPESERLLRYIESFLISSLLLSVIFVYLVAAYNITGVIQENGKHLHEFFYIHWLGDMAKEGAIFDANTNWNLIPSIAQTIITMLLNGQYRKYAVHLTDRENHKY